MSGAFSAAVLSEKLIKLNASQQSIESLSHWCIYHRKRAKQIVKTWHKEFFSAPREKRVSFLYLANDILQNSRKKGSEFVSEFWKVLNTALKDVKENGDDSGRNVVSRLVNIWEERKVFGARPQSLKETFLGDNPVPELELHEKQPEKGKEKENCIKITLDGSTLEKLVKAFMEVTENDASEEATLQECSSLKNRMSSGDQDSGEELQEHESKLKLLVDQLESHERARHQLVTHLRDALVEQETKLESIRSQIQGLNRSEDQKDSAPVDDGNPTTPAEFAAKLAASSSSAAMLSSILSSLTPGETASLGLHSDKRPRLESSSVEGGVYPEAQKFMMPPPVPMPPQFMGAPAMGLVFPPPPPLPPPGRPTGMQVPEMNPHLAHQHHLQLNPQLLAHQLNPQQMNPQQMPQQMNPQQMPQQMNPQQMQQILNPLPPGCAPNTYSLPQYYPSTQL